MKKSILLFAVVLSAATCFGQAPDGFNYQAIARDAAGLVISSTKISVRLSIHDSLAANPEVYAETDTITTNQFGLFSVIVGKGTVSTGGYPFSSVNWAKNDKFLQVQMDPTGR